MTIFSKNKHKNTMKHLLYNDRLQQLNDAIQVALLRLTLFCPKLTNLRRKQLNYVPLLSISRAVTYPVGFIVQNCLLISVFSVG